MERTRNGLGGFDYGARVRVTVEVGLVGWVFVLA